VLATLVQVADILQAIANILLIFQLPVGIAAISSSTYFLVAL